MPTTRNASAVILQWHLAVGNEHLVNAAELAAILHPGTAYAGVVRAAMALVCIACDPHAAQDYGPTATADEALRCILGSLLIGDPRPEAHSGPPGTPKEEGQVFTPAALAKATTVPPAVVAQSLSSSTAPAPEVPQGTLGL